MGVPKNLFIRIIKDLKDGDGCVGLCFFVCCVLSVPLSKLHLFLLWVWQVPRVPQTKANKKVIISYQNKVFGEIVLSRSTWEFPKKCVHTNYKDLENGGGCTGSVCVFVWFSVSLCPCYLFDFGFSQVSPTTVPQTKANERVMIPHENSVFGECVCRVYVRFK